MTIRVEEAHESRALRDAGYANQRSIEVVLYAYDDADNPADLDPVAVRAAVFSVLSASPYGDPLYGLWFQNLELDPINRFTFMAKGTWGVHEPVSVASGGVGSPILKWGFTTAGTTEHVTHSLSTIARYEATGAGTQPNFDKAVGVSEDGKQIAGYQRNIPSLSLWIEAGFDPSDWDATTLLSLTDMSWHYNLSTWKGWPAGQLMFTHCEAPEVTLGAATSGSPKIVPVKFYFLARGEEDIDKGHDIEFTKEPWSYVWDLTGTLPSTGGSNTLTKQILATYEEQIYAGADFSLLGIGT